MYVYKEYAVMHIKLSEKIKKKEYKAVLCLQ